MVQMKERRSVNVESCLWLLPVPALASHPAVNHERESQMPSDLTALPLSSALAISSLLSQQHLSSRSNSPHS